MNRINRTIKQMAWRKRIVAGLACAILSAPALAQEGVGYNEADRMMGFQAVELRDQLVFGLRCNLVEQTAFIDTVIAKVDAGEIPRSMVNVVFVWSKKRNPRVPFPYFETVLRMLAEKRGVDLPPSNTIKVATAY